MNDSNIAEGYDVFTGNIDESFPDNTLRKLMPLEMQLKTSRENRQNTLAFELWPADY